MSQSIGTRGQLASLSAPAVVFTVLLIAFPFGYTIWMSLHEFSFGGTSTMTYGQNYLLMLDDAEFWNGLRITVGAEAETKEVAAALRELAGAAR